MRRVGKFELRALDRRAHAVLGLAHRRLRAGRRSTCDGRPPAEVHFHPHGGRAHAGACTAVHERQTHGGGSGQWRGGAGASSCASSSATVRCEFVQLLARAQQHRALHFELLARDQVELGQAGLQHGLEVLLQFLAAVAQATGGTRLLRRRARSSSCSRSIMALIILELLPGGRASLLEMTPRRAIGDRRRRVGDSLRRLRTAATTGGMLPADATWRRRDEDGHGDHQAVQAGRRARGLVRGGRGGHHGHRGQGLRRQKGHTELIAAPSTSSISCPRSSSRSR